MELKNKQGVAATLHTTWGQGNIEIEISIGDCKWHIPLQKPSSIMWVRSYGKESSEMSFNKSAELDAIIAKYGEEGLMVGPKVIRLEDCNEAYPIFKRINGKTLQIGSVKATDKAQ